VPLQETVAPCASAAKRRLFVGNLDPALTEADVLTGFKRFGTVSEVSLFKDATTQVSTGHACVVFATADAALAAMGQLDGGSDMAAAGAELWVDWAIGQGDLLCIKEQEEERARRLRTVSC
jgi:RNA recognition motif-containing protein